MKKVLSLFVALCLLATTSLQTVLAQSTATVSLSSNSPVGNVLMSDNLKVLEFKFTSTNDLLLNKLKLTFEGTGASKIEKVMLLDKNASVLGQSFFVNSEVTFAGISSLAKSGDSYYVFIDFLDSAALGDTIKVNISGVEVFDNVTAEVLNLSSQLPLQGNLLTLTNTSPSNSTVWNVLSSSINNNDSVLKAGEFEQVLGFQFTTTENLQISNAKIEFSGNLNSYVEMAKLIDGSGNVIGQVVPSSGVVIFASPFSAEKGKTSKFFVEVKMSANTVSNATLKANLVDLSVQNTVTAEVLSLASKLPVVGSQFYMNDSQSPVWNISPVSTSNNDLKLKTGEFEEVLGYQFITDKNLKAWDPKFEFSGNGKDYIDSVKLVDSDNKSWGQIIPENGSASFATDFEIGKGKNQRFFLEVKMAANAPLNASLKASLVDLKVQDSVTALMLAPGNRIPIKGETYKVSDLSEDSKNVFAIYKASFDGDTILKVGENEKVLGFQISAKKNLAISNLKIEFSGDAKKYVETAKLLNYKDEEIDKSFPLNNITKFLGLINLKKSTTSKFFVMVKMSEDVPEGASLKASLIDLKVQDMVTAEILSVDGKLPVEGYVYTVGDQEKKNEDKKSDKKKIERDYEQIIADWQNYENPFADVSSEQAQTLKGQAALYLSSKNIIRGYITKNKPFTVEFKGDRQLNRAEVAKFIVNSLGYTDKDYCEDVKFKDMKKSDWYNRYVCTAVELGIIKGYADNTFRGAQPVTKAEFLKMLVESHKLSKGLDFEYEDVNDSDWYATYVGVAQELGLFPESAGKFEPNKVLNRWETAVAIYLVLNK